MIVSEHLEKITRKLSSLTKEIEDLQSDLTSIQHPSDKDKCSECLESVYTSVMAYLALNPQMEKDGLLKILLRCARYAVNSGGAEITLFDHKKNKLVFKAAIGDGADELIGSEIPIDEESWHGLALLTGEVQSGTPLKTDTDLLETTRIWNILIAPLIAHGETIGTISAVNKQEGEHFTDRDIKTYKWFAYLASLMIRNHLREQLLKEIIKGDAGETPDELKNLAFGSEGPMLIGIVKDVSKLARKREDLLPLLKQFVGMMLEVSDSASWWK